ncbi:2-C-methyl-D-erythritol 4-phosphate cytidylyltransferase [candidate division NPL-UPA2 bacterium]|nr:2-C-methyl-D-erythritol 4-phosphate cytidylyltransferase [candidate division NPL-UPA2 bacterium]
MMPAKIVPKKNSSLKVTTIIPAAGRGERMKGKKIGKQYLPLGGKPILVHTLLAFEECPSIEEIILAVREEEIGYCQLDIVKRFGLGKVKEIVAGGERRQDSVYNALKKVRKDCHIILVHDSVRPFVTRKIIQRAIEEIRVHKAVATAVPVTDTIKEGNGQGFVEKTLNRDCLWSIQTPQGFESHLIKEAYSRAYEENFYGTDDASLVERMGHSVKAIEGSHENIKITTPEDLIIAEAILRKRG